MTGSCVNMLFYQHCPQQRRASFGQSFIAVEVSSVLSVETNLAVVVASQGITTRITSEVAVLLQKGTNILILLLGMNVVCNVALAVETNTKSATVEAEHARAVALARNDHTDEGLAILRKLLQSHPSSYPIRRDYVVIATWKGDCDEALSNYKIIEDHPAQEAYLVVPVSECLHRQRKDNAALALLKKHSKASPDDEELKQAYRDLADTVRIDRLPDVTAVLGVNDSDAGNREWFWDLRYSRQVTPDLPQLRGYIHYGTSHAVDAEFATGDLHRLGVGALYWFNYQWLLDQELFTDLQNNETGSRTRLHYYVNSQLHLSAEYSSNTSDIPLRAKAQSIKARQLQLDADYHSSDYRWEAYGAASKDAFSDTNDRTSLYGSVGYGYLMKPKLEQRVILELSRSRNTLAGTVYYNPAKDSGVNLIHRTSYVYDSRYDRHVDNLSVFVGKYNEQGYDAGTVYGVRYEQEYDFDTLNSLSWAAGYASRLYDGDREGELSFLLTLSRKLD